ncbi:uncharacterized protein N7482_007069 [Penicillium canariense]|uniref:Uncharacterized protein n=1 Tax=Penicillium canariense TaxID=189055 RepID=A0A9W9HYV0_9EURO|nr:uncharacterized protein N7482_007069 [Penicillium canariense]KAJ5160065.1 hypothetical protein N7482_007069 [Penicillium canariense]
MYLTKLSSRAKAMVVLLFFGFGLWLLIIPFRAKPQKDCEPPDLSVVSGYYGPGSLLAWLVAILSSVLSHEFSVGSSWAEAFHISPRLAAAIREDEHPLEGIDGAQLTAAAYSMGAILDLAFRSIAGKNDAQNAASYTITWLSLFFFACCNATERRQNQRRSRVSRFWYRFWRMNWLFAAVAHSIQSLMTMSRDADTTGLWFIAGGLSLLYVISLLITVQPWDLAWVEEPEDPTTRTRDIHGAELMCSVLLMAIDVRRRSTPWNFQLRCGVVAAPWSLTKAKLTDMDQMAAFCVAVGATVLPWVVTTLKKYRSGR